MTCDPDCAFQGLDGALLYRDDDHLSAHGARLLVPRLMRAAREDAADTAVSSSLGRDE
jgi:hypothetical protein